jgi:hypothetical protein
MQASTPLDAISSTVTKRFIGIFREHVVNVLAGHLIENRGFRGGRRDAVYEHAA